MSNAVVRDRGYSGYDGPRHEGRASVVLLVHTAIGLINRKASKRALSLAWLSAIITGVVIYTEHKIGGANTGALYPLFLLTKPYGVLGPTLFAGLLAAGGTIAEDRRAGALPFYFARPLRPIDYLLGRAGGVFAAMLVIAAAPVTVLAIYRALLCDALGDALRALGVALVVALLAVLLSALVTLLSMLGSAIAGSRGAAQAFVGAVFVLPWILAGVGANVLDGPWASLLSIPHLLESAGEPLIGAIAGEQRTLAEIVLSVPAARSHDPHIPPAVALGAMVVLGALAWWAVRSRIEALGKAGGAAGGGA